MIGTDLERLFEVDLTADPCEPRTEMVARPDLVIRCRHTAARGAWSSWVQRARWSEDDAERGIDEALAFFAARDLPFVWSVGPDSTPPSLGERLRRRGLTLEATAARMAAALPIAGLRTNDAIVVREADDEATMLDSLRVENSLRESPYDDATLRATLDERMAYVRCPSRSRRFAVAYLDGEAVASARWRYEEERRGVHLSGAETRPDRRSRGAYSTLVAYRTARAIERGLRHATIFADLATSAPILRRRGFVEAGVVEYWLCR